MVLAQQGEAEGIGVVAVGPCLPFPGDVAAVQVHLDNAIEAGVADQDPVGGTFDEFDAVEVPEFRPFHQIEDFPGFRPYHLQRVGQRHHGNTVAAGEAAHLVALAHPDVAVPLHQGVRCQRGDEAAAPLGFAERQKQGPEAAALPRLAEFAAVIDQLFAGLDVLDQKRHRHVRPESGLAGKGAVDIDNSRRGVHSMGLPWRSEYFVSAIMDSGAADVKAKHAIWPGRLPGRAGSPSPPTSPRPPSRRGPPPAPPRSPGPGRPGP